MAKYKYSALIPENNEIRLIKLHPSPSYQAPLIIDLYHRPFSSNPLYEALSYAWGSPSDKSQKVYVRARSQTITTNAAESAATPNSENLSELRITPNLDVALRNLRNSQDPWIVWIDGICLNQEDNAEKSVAVLKMGDIYRKAQRVVIWLGPKNESSTLAVETLQGIADDLYDIDGGFGARKNSETWEFQDSAEGHRKKEFELATNVVFLVDKDCLELDAFERSLEWIATQTKVETTVLSDIITQATLIKLFQFRQKVPIYSNQQSFLQRSQLAQKLALTSQRECFNPRDRIYAILSIADLEGRLGIVPSYDQAPEAVYKDATLRDFRYTSRLDMLDLCGRRSPPSKLILPSWVPDLSIRYLCQPLQYIPFMKTADPSIYHNSIDNTRRIQGRRIDIIAQVATPILPDASLQETLAICYSWEPPDAENTNYIGGGSTLDAFIKLLMVGSLSETDPLGFYGAPSLKGCRTAYQEAVREGKTPFETTYRFTSRIQHFARGRRFFITQDGYIGLGLAEISVGDHVLCVLGATFPLVVRPTDKKTNLAAYSPDVMTRTAYTSQTDPNVSQTGNFFAPKRVEVHLQRV
ncbi:hypothetical protein N431DRAFT_466814 [Stipitochalara longipes BDJ]|nr:hypothetical protein N431DRAFT_466814 [Stipitochalara longipes BDJ]